MIIKCGNAPLLAEGPKLYGAVRAPGETLCAISVEHERLDVIRVPLQLHQLGARSRVPHTQDLLGRSADYDRARGIHGETVNGVFVAVETRCGHRIVGGRQCCQGVHVPQEYGLVESGRCDLLPILGVRESLHVVLVRP